MIKPYMVDMILLRKFSPTEPDRFENPDVVEEFLIELIVWQSLSCAEDVPCFSREAFLYF